MSPGFGETNWSTDTTCPGMVGRLGWLNDFRFLFLQHLDSLHRWQAYWLQNDINMPQYSSTNIPDCNISSLQKTATVEETLTAKQAFELFASSHGVHILNYHVENGVFRANNWIKACQSDPNPQGMTFAGVNAHHTNGLA